MWRVAPGGDPGAKNHNHKSGVMGVSRPAKGSSFSASEEVRQAGCSYNIPGFALLDAVRWQVFFGCHPNILYHPVTT